MNDFWTGLTFALDLSRTVNAGYPIERSVRISKSSSAVASSDILPHEKRKAMSKAAGIPNLLHPYFRAYRRLFAV